MSTKRVPLSERRAKDREPVAGVDSIFEPSEPEPAEPTRVAKITLYVRPDQVVAIEQIQLNERVRTGSKPDKSALIQEAIDLLSQKYGIPASQ